jgi:hypothetical protein
MKTLFVSLAALVAVSSAALASERGPHDSDTHFGMPATDSNALIIVNEGKADLIVFERMNPISDENERGGSFGRDHDRSATKL